MLAIYFVFFLYGYVDSSVIDQRQVGDLNVQIDVKDVQIFAVMKAEKEEYVNYDYAYDYSEFTIKPQNRTTTKPLNGMTTTTRVTASNISEPVTVPEESTTSSKIEELVTLTPSENISTNGPVLDENTMKVNLTKSPITPPLNTTVKNCKKGFILNQKGDCQLKLNTTGNALLKLVKLSQKLKLRRENQRAMIQND